MNPSFWNGFTVGLATGFIVFPIIIWAVDCFDHWARNGGPVQ